MERKTGTAGREAPWWGLWAVGGMFAVLGIAALLVTNAAPSLVTAEAETGTVAGRAAAVSDAAASGGSFVTFGRPLQYVSLGDSVASGDGIEYGWKWTPDGAGDGNWVRTGPASPLWEPAADTQPEVQACHRSKKAYPYLLAAATGHKHYNPSCSGASVLNGVLKARSFNASLTGLAQVGSAKAGYAPPNADYDVFKPDIVTVTLGMDDIGFSDILRRCYLGTTCVTPENEQDVNQRLAKLKTDLGLLMTELKDRGTAANKLPWVVLTNYYDPFHPDSSRSCRDTHIGLGNGLGANEIDWMRGKMQAMNQVISEAASGYPKSKVADISKALAGHEFCTADPWVYGISIWRSDFGNPAPFHPTPAGQEAITKLLLPVINGLR